VSVLSKMMCKILCAVSIIIVNLKITSCFAVTSSDMTMIMSTARLIAQEQETISTEIVYVIALITV